MTHDSPLADYHPAELDAVEQATREVGRQVFERLKSSATSLLHRRWWDDQLLNWTMQDQRLRVELFRFVDVLPMLRTPEAIVGHLHEYLQTLKSHLPLPLRMALGMSRWARLTHPAVVKIVQLATEDLAKRFIAGSNTVEVLAAARREREAQRAFTLDILGEAVITEGEAERFCRAYTDLIAAVAPTVNTWPECPLADRDERGELPRANVSIKLSALDSQFDPIDPGGTRDRVGGRLREVLRVARQQRAFVNVDMESYDKKDLTLQIFRELLSEPEFRDVVDVGIVVQCYLRDAEQDLRGLHDWVRQRGTPVWVRLVKGAYWDFETVRAAANGWPVPVFTRKADTDRTYERATRYLLRHRADLRPAFGTHNIRSAAHAIAVARHLDASPTSFELQMLFGMGDAEKEAFVELGHRMRVYMPYGELIPGMAYLVRRLLENTSNDSFLRAGFVEHRPIEELLASPVESLEAALSAERYRVRTEESPVSTQPFAAPFVNEPPIDFSREENRVAMQEALHRVLSQLGQYHPLVLGGKPVRTPARLSSYDPSYCTRLVGETALAEPVHVEAAVAAAREAWPAWRARPVQERAAFLRRAAERMRQRRFDLAALQVYECGKGWREATADVNEAIDFCEYYAAGADDLQRPQGADVPGEENRFEYLPRGVTAVIAPWNFPLAILTGMTTAALVTGNPVVMKPAEQASIVAATLQDIFDELELPPGVLNFLPGPGEIIGAALVAHPDVATIAFTGSRDVGLAIQLKAAEFSTRLPYVKRVIAEMGGKNAIIVDADADLDEAVMGVLKSAFGYQGQKCSACSRAIVLEAVYQPFLERLVEATASLTVGPAEHPATSVGPVIDEAARRKCYEYIELGRKEAREVLSVDVETLAEQGYFVGPHIFADVPPSSRLAREEIFGPVLAVIRAADLSQALEYANATDYALTGGIYSRSPANLARARQEFLVGNLYLNRPITGALVGRQPFGGFKLSGVGSKAGGPDYLLQFVQPRTITENTLRRGFAP